MTRFPHTAGYTSAPYTPGGKCSEFILRKSPQKVKVRKSCPLHHHDGFIVMLDRPADEAIHRGEERIAQRRSAPT